MPKLPRGRPSTRNVGRTDATQKTPSAIIAQIPARRRQCATPRAYARRARDLAAELSEARSPADEVPERGRFQTFCEGLAGFDSFHCRCLHLVRMKPHSRPLPTHY